MLPPCPTLEVDLAAIARNYTLLKQQYSGRECASVVKANAYGLGVEAVAPALAKAGCETFFVATLEEAIALRGITAKAQIFLFHGAPAGEEKAVATHRLIPVLNSTEQITRWAEYNKGQSPAALHVDTGMSRLGVSFAELESHLLQRLAACNITLLMSHLAMAESQEHAKNNAQLTAFRKAATLLPGTIEKSLVNSAGVFLATDYHFDIARPGCALYGINPLSDNTSPVEQVVRLSAPILQIREVKKGETIGYGASFTAPRDSRIATIELGYADGYLRHLSNVGVALIEGREVPIAGRISMDMITLDITGLPEPKSGARAEFISTNLPVDRVARLADTIGYEILSRLGDRVQRIYHGQSR